jgi:hypothetical protein
MGVSSHFFHKSLLIKQAHRVSISGAPSCLIYYTKIFRDVTLTFVNTN